MNKKNIIFDLGNVLINVDFNRLYQKLKDNHIEINKHNIKIISDFNHKFNLGETNSDEFYNNLSLKIINFNKNISENDFFKYWCDIFSLNTKLIDYAKKLATSFNIFFASNTDQKHFAYVNKKFNLDFIPLGNRSLSYQEKCIKSNIDFFEKLIYKYQLKTDDKYTIFIDDLFDNIESAKKAGLNSFQNIDNDKTIHFLNNFINS